VKKLWSLNTLWKFWCRLRTSFHFINVTVASSNFFFLSKLRLNMGRSCTIQKPDIWVVGPCWTFFFFYSFEVIYRNIHGLVGQGCGWDLWRKFALGLAFLCNITYTI
jgi:hypothetical protein